MPEGELSQDDIDSLLNMAGGEPPQGEGAVEAGGAQVTAAGEPEPPPAPAPVRAAPPAPEQIRDAFSLLKDVPLNVRIELGRSKMYIEDILKLGKGSVAELDKLGPRRAAKKK